MELTAEDKFRTKSDILISYEELSKIPLYEVQQIFPDLPGAIEYIRISSNAEDTLMFTVTMKKGQLWEKHHHDCKETCVIYKGTLRDVMEDRSATTAEVLEFLPNKSHFVVAEEDTIFYVEFKKPN